MKVLIYATTFGADLWAFTHWMDNHTDSEIRVLLNDPESFSSEAIEKIFPLNVQFIKRKWHHSLFGLNGFSPDVTIMDNRIPLFAPSPKGFVLWHGFGWKGPNDEQEFKWLHFSLKNCWGSAKQPNKDFYWQCFGPWDFKHRTVVSGFHPDNCRILGAASHDYLREPIATEKLQPFYPFDVVNKPTVLIAPTWHYGEVFSHWGNDRDLFPELLDHITAKGANVILRLHDSFRFDKEYREFLNSLSSKYENVQIKFKNYNPDNLLDLQVSDLLITNYSSIANLFYATGRPTLHVYPVEHADEEFLTRNHTFAGVYTKKVNSARYVWKLDPEENGGLLSNDFNELKSQVDYALANPDCCKTKAENFLNEYMLGADGNNCDRVWDALEELVSEKKKHLKKPEFAEIN